MGEGLKRKLGPLPVWGWGLLVGGTIGVVVLLKKAKGSTVAPEPVPEHLSIPGVEGSAGGLGGGGIPGEVKSPIEALPAIAPTAPGPSTATPVSELLASERELREGGWRSPGEGAAPSGSAAPAVAAALSAASGGLVGRGGVSYKTSTYKGHTAHVYSRAVPGGVGPGKNVIVIGAAGKKTHAAKPSHAPAHVKRSSPHHKPSPRPKPVHHARPPGTGHPAAKRRTPKPRRRAARRR